MFTDAWDGFISYFRILPYIRRFGLGLYMVLTGILSLLIAGGILYSAWKYSPLIGDWVSSFYSLEFGARFFAGLADWLSAIAIVAISIMLYKYIILILAAPIMSLVSEKIENGLVSGEEGSIQFSFSRAVKEMIRGIRISIRNIVREIVFTILLLAASLFLPLAIITGPGILIVQAYYAGFGNMDFYLERHCNIRESVYFVRSHKALAISNGAVYLLLLVIPIIGLIVAPTLGTAAATTESMKRMGQI